MIIGQIYRTARPYGPDPEVIDGYPNYFYETHCEDMPLLNLERGIFTPARTIAESGVRRSIVILSRAIASAGTEQNPWAEDNFDVENGVIYYSGDNKVSGADPDRAHGNRELIAQFHMTRSDDIIVRQKAAPIVCFERVAVNGQEKGYLKFQGYGFVNDFELIEEHYATGVTFENYRFEIALLPTDRDNFFDWTWINKRRSAQYKDEDTLKYAPSAWRRMVVNGFEVVKIKRSGSNTTNHSRPIGSELSQKTVSVRAIAEYVGEDRTEVLKHVLDWLREDHSQKKYISQIGENWFVDREWFLTRWQREVLSTKNVMGRHALFSASDNDRWLSSLAMASRIGSEVSRIDHLLSQASDDGVISSNEAKFTTLGWVIREGWGKNWLHSKLRDSKTGSSSSKELNQQEPAPAGIATAPSDETTSKFESLNVFERELDIPVHAMELLLNAQLSQGNISESDALYFKSGWVVSRDWFIPWVLNLTGKSSVPDFSEIDDRIEPTTPEPVSSSDRSPVSSVGSLLDELESKLDQLMAPDPAHNEVEESVQVEEDDVDEDPHGIMLPKAVEVFKKHFEIQSSIRNDLDLIYANGERITSLLEENIDKDESATESFLGRVLLRSVEEVKQEHEFVRKQLRNIRDENDAVRIVKTLSEGIGRVDATLDRLEAMVVQSLEVQKEALDLLLDSTTKLQSLNETLPEKALFDQFDNRDFMIELEKFMNSGSRKTE